MLCVLMPAYNCERYVEGAIRSILEQERPMALRILVADDGSTDGTAAVVRGLAAQHGEVSLFETENRGVAAARNLLLSHLPDETHLVSFLDADDAMPAHRIARDVALLEKSPEADLVYGRMCMVASRAPDLRGEDIAECTRARGASVSAGTFRIDLIRLNGAFDPSFTHGEDLDYLLRMFERRPEAILLDEDSILYRRHGEGATSDMAALRRGILRAMMLHTRRLRNDPALAKVDTLFSFDA